MAVGAAFAALAWSSQRGLGMLWDEKVDLQIAAAFLDHPLYGSGQDGSQMRLPMMVNAVVFGWVGASLHVSRAVSVAVGLATVLATFGLGRRLFDGWTGLVAAVIVGFSPYFLGFSRIAMTEGDVFPALFVTLTCWAYVHYADRRDGPRLALVTVTLALAIGAKLYAVFLIPVFGLCELVDARVRAAAARTARETTTATPARGSTRWWVLAAAGCVALAAMSAGLAQLRRVDAAMLIWALLLVATTAVIVGLFRGRHRHPSRATGWAVISMLALATACAAMPQHVIHPDIARTIIRRAVYWDHLIPGALWLDHLRLYSGILLFGATLPVGLASLAALVWAWVRENDRPELRLPVFAVSFYILALTTLPLRQTFYLMNVYPLIAILTAAALIASWRWLTDRSRLAGRGGMLVIVLTLGQLIYAAANAWPDYNLYPRRWVGTRWLGAEARGYRNLVHTPCDGYADLVDWGLANVQPSQRVVSYLWADHVLDDLIPADLPFTLIRRGVYEAANLGLPRPDPPNIDQADYVLLHINNIVGYHDAPPPDLLARLFGDCPAHTVYRDGDFPIAWVYGRPNPSRPVPARPQ